MIFISNKSPALADKEVAQWIKPWTLSDEVLSSILVIMCARVMLLRGWGSQKDPLLG